MKENVTLAEVAEFIAKEVSKRVRVMTEPRPILVVRHPLTNGGEAHPDFIKLVEKEGYLVIQGNPDDVRVLAREADKKMVAELAASCHEHFGALPGDWDQIVERHFTS